MYFKNILYASFFCLCSMNAVALTPSGTDIDSECIYIAPEHQDVSNVFEEIKAQSDQTTETFSDIVTSLHAIKDSCHQFYFQYPLKDADHAKVFAKVMEIKAQEAHRFVPVISDCRFIEPRHLGFSRRISIVDGPNVQEHALVDSNTHSVIFIEEFAIAPNDELLPGAFAALNQIMEENGAWYFSGIYLYEDQPSAEEILEKEVMFRLTYDNMLKFIEDHDVDLIYSNLKKYK